MKKFFFHSLNYENQSLQSLIKQITNFQHIIKQKTANYEKKMKVPQFYLFTKIFYHAKKEHAHNFM